MTERKWVLPIAATVLVGAGIYSLAIAPKPAHTPFFCGDYMIDLGDGYCVGYGPGSGFENAVVLRWNGELVVEGVERYAKVPGAVVGRTASEWFICKERAAEVFLDERAWRRQVQTRYSCSPTLKRPVNPYLLMFLGVLGVVGGAVVLLFWHRSRLGAAAALGRATSDKP